MMKRFFSVLATALVAGAAGCSHEVESPSLSLTDLQPGLVCNAQRLDDASVVISGSGFTPMPTNVLATPSILILPTVDVAKSSDLFPGLAADAGASVAQAEPMSGFSSHVSFSGDPKGALAGDLSWQSNDQMTLRVTEEPPVKLVPGIYDIKVTNPDQKAQGALKEALAVVPPPLVTAIVPPAICVDQTDQVVTVQGADLAHLTGGGDGDGGDSKPKITVTGPDGATHDFVPDSLEDCTALPAKFRLELCNSMTFTVKQGELDPGKYTLTVTDPAPLSCTTSAPIDFTVNAPPKVTSVAPHTVCSGGSVLVATGEGFQTGATAELRCGSATPVASASVDVSADGTTATITFGPGAVPGVDCDVVVINPDTCEDRPLPHQVVTGTDGPILFNVDPDVAYNGINTKVLLYVTALSPPPTVKMWPSGGDQSQATTLASNVVPGKTTVIQATIPKGTKKGQYAMAVEDESGCAATLDPAITVTDDVKISTGKVTPPFGHVTESVPVTITLGTPVTWTGTPRAFLNPPGATDPAIQLQSVTVVNNTTLTGVVPKNTPAGTYQLVIVWPSGEVAVIDAAYTSVSAAPPVVDDVEPQSVVNQAGQSLTITGTGFSGSSVTVICNQGATTINATAAAPTCAAGSCTQTATFDASTIAQGDACVVRVTNSDKSYGDFSAIGVTNSSLNIADPKPGKDLLVGRRALMSAAVKATSAARFLYAIGGDTGQVSGALASVEFSPVDVFGNMNNWAASPTSLKSKRSFAGTASIGRYIYVFGGNDGTGALGSGERALVLSPEEIPIFDGLDLCLAGGQDCFNTPGLGSGLTAGAYSYRVSAVIGAGDAQNLGGETLASDPIIMKLRSVNGRSVTVKIQWSAPKDRLGADLTGITGYRVYRTPKDGAPGTDEVLIADLKDATTLSFIDDGSKPLGTAKPLPLGSTSAWQALPVMATKREGPGGAAARDPNDASKWYVYSLLGRDGATASRTYEHLAVTIQPNGRQTVGTWTTGAQQSAVGRWQFGTWTVNSTISGQITNPTETWIYAGGGVLANGTTEDGSVEAGRVQQGGELSGFATTQDFSSTRAGYGTAAAADLLFVFGGKKAAQVLQNSTSAAFQGAPPGLAPNAWNNQGITLQSPRYLMGSSIQSAFIFLVAGATNDAGAVTKSTETVVW